MAGYPQYGLGAATGVSNVAPPDTRHLPKVSPQKGDTVRVAMAGGDVLSLTLPDSTPPFEQLYRKQPAEGMFDAGVSPSNPFVFEMGAFSVPSRMTLLVYDIRADIYRFSGFDAGDTLPVDSRRFSSFLGYDITVDGRRQGNLSFQLDPTPIVNSSQVAFASNTFGTANSAQTVAARFGQFAGASAAAQALQPQRPTRYGAENLPFTLIAKSNQTVQVRCVIFRPLLSPVAFFEYSIGGLLVPESWSDTILNWSKYPQDNKESQR
jgi:hypothetical protein